MRISPYLFFAGNCEEAFAHYAEVLGGEIEAMLRHAGTPPRSMCRPNGARRSCTPACVSATSA
jgi:PhnB protein